LALGRLRASSCKEAAKRNGKLLCLITLLRTSQLRSRTQSIERYGRTHCLVCKNLPCGQKILLVERDQEVGRLTKFRKLIGGRAHTEHRFIDCRNSLPKSLPNFAPNPPGPCPVVPTSTGVSDEDTQSDFFRHVFRSADFNRSPTAPFVILAYSPICFCPPGQVPRQSNPATKTSSRCFYPCTLAMRHPRRNPPSLPAAPATFTNQRRVIPP